MKIQLKRRFNEQLNIPAQFQVNNFTLEGEAKFNFEEF